MKFSKIRQIAKGWSSYIWIVKTRGTNKIRENHEDGKKNEFILKEVREKSPRKDLAEREGKMLTWANSVGVGPKVKEVNYIENYVLMEYIHGEKLFDWILNERFDKEVTREEFWRFLKRLYAQGILLDSINLSHNQLEGGKNILVSARFDKKTQTTEYYPTIIDFEKATIKNPGQTRNIGQIESMFFYNPNNIVSKKSREKLNAII
ncbi:MAG: hypothetical protein NTY48_00435 [Candidatus Diapherotrites archaeon]|nr:hypothetical protein [Candidatus Diapherotrites archaeon]